MVDAVRFPGLARYLDTLPAGLDSYPECETKGVILRGAIDGHPLDEVAAGLPEELRSALDQPPPGGVWIPAVLSDCAFHAVCDRYYPTESAMIEWTYSRTKSVATNRLYRGLFRVAGPAAFLALAERLHNQMFQRGTILKVKLERQLAEFRLGHPPRLHSRLNHLSNVPLLHAVIELAGGQSVRVDMKETGDQGALYIARWG
ncbi:MAG: hypothetical protein AAGF12_21480 [Myxococcota bacterium]